MRKTSLRGFTLVELLVVIAIISLLASMAMPELDKMMERAKSITCMGNLRQIGTAMNLYVADNDGTFPYIEPNPEHPVYDEEILEDIDLELPPDDIYKTLNPYGLVDQATKCPMDKRDLVRKEEIGSYQWRPLIDGDEPVSAQVVTRRGGLRTIKKLSRFIICTDFDAVHFNRLNRLFADGHAEAVLKAP